MIETDHNNRLLITTVVLGGDAGIWWSGAGSVPFQLMQTP